MSSYRFCRTDDIGLLVDALNRCWRPHFPAEPEVTPATFKRSIRDLQVWCSSCMVAFARNEPIAVLIGAKRASATLIYRIAVHPDHLRQGHGRHLLQSLSSKLAILGPPRIVAEVPEALGAASALFSAAGYKKVAVLTDYVLPDGDTPTTGTSQEGLTIPFTVDDLVANGLLENDGRWTCWQRSVETLMARKAEIAGLAVASDERIEAYVLYVEEEILLLGTRVEDGGARVHRLLTTLRGGARGTLRMPKVHPDEIPTALLGSLGFQPAGTHLVFTAVPQSH